MRQLAVETCRRQRRSAARLLVAADGARSSIRERAGIAVHGWNYGQSAIVTKVSHERDHEGRAVEHFLPAGPFAILPLKGHRSSIVWTETDARKPSGSWRCPTTPSTPNWSSASSCISATSARVGARRAHPLGFFVARSFIADRIALVGDAAHVIHPIAGQGLNMGLRDVAALAEVIVDAARLGSRYRRRRRARALSALAALRHHDHGRDDRRAEPAVLQPAPPCCGSSATSGSAWSIVCPTSSSLFIREAAGLVGDVPKLLRGKSL